MPRICTEQWRGEPPRMKKRKVTTGTRATKDGAAFLRRRSAGARPPAGEKGELLLSNISVQSAQSAVCRLSTSTHRASGKHVSAPPFLPVLNAGVPVMWSIGSSQRAARTTATSAVMPRAATGDAAAGSDPRKSSLPAAKAASRHLAM